VSRKWRTAFHRGAWLALAAGLASAGVQAPVAADQLVSDEWQFQVTPYLWGTALDGDVKVKGVKSSPSISFRDILENLNYSMMVEGEARKGRFGVYVNANYTALSDDNKAAGLRIRANAQLAYAGAGAYYRLGPWSLDDEAGGSGPQLVVDPFAGARYTYLNARLKIRNGGPQGEQDKHWVDPIIGLRGILQITPKWSVTALGDVGGFGVGSDLTWQAAGMVGYRFGLFGENNARFLAGYRALYQDYKDGSGSNKFEWDMTLYGPILGLALDF